MAPCRAPDEGSASSGQPAARASSVSGPGSAPSPATITPRSVQGRSRAAGAAAPANRVQGAPPGRPASDSAPSAVLTPSGSPGTSGSRSGRFRCTGPGMPPAAPLARAQARPASERQYPARPGRASGTPTSQNQRTASPYSLSWSMAWLAPVPRSSGGRSAVSTSSGTPASSASMTAAWKCAAAVPEVHSAAAGRPLALARPRARNAADRSSTRTCSRSSPRWLASNSASASGVLREPGATTASRRPHRRSSSTSTRASAVAGFAACSATAADPTACSRPCAPARHSRG